LLDLSFSNLELNRAEISAGAIVLRSRPTNVSLEIETRCNLSI